MIVDQRLRPAGRLLLGVALACALAGPAAAGPLFARNSVWKYLATPVALPSTWKDPGYADGTWPSGPGVLGFGEGFIATPVPYGNNASQKYLTTYFRIAFPGPAHPESVVTLGLDANYDDGLVAYLNGFEIARRGLPAGPVAYATLATSHEGGTYERVNVSAAKALLVAGTNVLAVEVHQTDPTSTDLVWDAGLQASQLPLVTRGPYLQRITPGAATVRWRTSPASASEVRYGPSPGALTGVVSDAASTTEHELTIAGLAPGTRVFYAVGVPGTTLAGGDSAHAFTTAPPFGQVVPQRAWVIGDAGRGNLQQAQVRDGAAAFLAPHPADVWLMLGDNAYDTGTDVEYQTKVFQVYPQRFADTPLFPTRGNHDVVVTGANNDYYDFFTLPSAGEAGGVPSGTEAYYSYDRGNVHFICLDSEGSAHTVGAPMLNWLRQDLAATTATWSIAYWHHPPYTKGTHDSDDPYDSEGKMRDMRQVVLPVLDSLGVDLVLCGHSHVYERSFLIAGHYGLSTTFQPAMLLDGGDGREEGSGAYHKATVGRAPYQGVVYVVCGTSGLAETGPLDHPVMAVSMSALGSMVLDASGTRLDARFVSTGGTVLDHFTILKGSSQVGAPPPPPDAVRLECAGPNPSALVTRLQFALPAAAEVRLTIVDAAGRRVATLVDGPRTAGAHPAWWNGTNEAGRRAPAGLYFAVLESGGERRVLKLARLR